MKFLVLLLTFVVQRRFNLALSQQHDAWAVQFLSFFEKKMPVVRHHTALYLAIGIFLPALMLTGLLIYIDDLLYGAVALFVSFIMLFMCFGCGYLKAAIDAYIQFWQQGRYQSAYEALASADIHIEHSQNLSAAEIHYEVCVNFIYHTFQRYFGIIFWFMLVGPVGALVARLAQVTSVKHSAYRPKSVDKLSILLEWIPARLLGLTFALVGNFSGAMKQGLNSLIDPHSSARDVLKYSASGAVSGTKGGYSAEIEPGPAQREADVKKIIALRGVLNRALIVWLAVLAMVTIVSWIS